MLFNKNSCHKNCRLTKERIKQKRKLMMEEKPPTRKEKSEVPTQDDEMAYLIIA